MLPDCSQLSKLTVVDLGSQPSNSTCNCAFDPLTDKEFKVDDLYIYACVCVHICACVCTSDSCVMPFLSVPDDDNTENL
jgi:hypothetical protein